MRSIIPFAIGCFLFLISHTALGQGPAYVICECGINNLSLGTYVLSGNCDSLNCAAKGLWKIVNKQGDVVEERNYLNGRRVGLSKKYYDDGSLRSELTYNSSGLLTKAVQYHQTGLILSVQNMNENGYHGIQANIIFPSEKYNVQSFENGKMIKQEVRDTIKLN